MRLLLFSAIVFSYMYVQVSSTCLCNWPNPGPSLKTIFCGTQNRYLLRAKITSHLIRLPDAEAYYRLVPVVPIHTHSEPGAKLPDTTRVYTMYGKYDDAFCGVRLAKGEYLLMGSIVNGKLRLGLCDVYMFWSPFFKHLDPEFKAFVQTPRCDETQNFDEEE